MKQVKAPASSTGFPLKTLGQEILETFVLDIMVQFLINDKKIATPEIFICQIVEDASGGHLIDSCANRPDISATPINCLSGSFHQHSHFLGSVMALSHICCVCLILPPVFVMDGVCVKVSNFDGWQVLRSLFEKNVGRRNISVDDSYTMQIADSIANALRDMEDEIGPRIGVQHPFTD